MVMIMIICLLNNMAIHKFVDCFTLPAFEITLDLALVGSLSHS